MNKKLARLVLAVAQDNASTCAYSNAQDTVAMLIIEYWHYTQRSDAMHDVVAEWRNKRDYASATALAAWLLAQ